MKKKENKVKPNKDYYEIRFSADELRMIDAALSRGPIDKDGDDDYNRIFWAI